MWYASLPGRRAFQVAGDLFLIAWCCGWVLAGIWVHGLVAALAEPVLRLRTLGSSYDQVLREQGDRLLELPLLGERLRDAFHAAAAPGVDLARAGADLADTLGRVAFGLGVVTAVAPILLAAVPWLYWRVRFARRARATARLVAAGASLDLLALRALAGRSLPVLTRIDLDPCRGWRQQDAGTIRALADLELAACGIRAAGRPGPAPIETRDPG